jgi:hypothetical protein
MSMPPLQQEPSGQIRTNTKSGSIHLAKTALPEIALNINKLKQEWNGRTPHSHKPGLSK